MSSDRIPTVVSATEFSAEKDAEALNKAFQGLGTNEPVVTGILAKRSMTQREDIQDAYEEKYEKSLLDDIRSETSGDYLQTLEGLLEPPNLFHAKYINNVLTSISLTGDKGLALIEILCPFSALEMNVVKTAFEQVTGNKLLEVVKSKVSGPFKDALIKFVEKGRMESTPTPTKIAEDSAYLKELPADQWTPANTKLMDMLLANSTFYLFSLFQSFNTVSECNIVDYVETTPKDEFKAAFKAIVTSSQDLYQFFADQLYGAMKGFGTNEAKLIYITLFRCEMDLGNIKDAFKTKYNQNLVDLICDETSGDLRGILTALVGPEPTEQPESQDTTTTGS